MVDIGNPYNRESLLDALEKVNWVVTKIIHDLTLDDYYSRYDKQWSAADTVQHLVKSVKPVTVTLRWPKLVLAMRYGRIDRPSRRYDQIADRYIKTLAKGDMPPDKHAPVLYEIPYTEEEAEKFQKQDLKNWRKATNGFQRTVARWYDFQMDRYQLPHPVLDKVTVREMLMFTIFHTKYHTDSIVKRIRAKAAPAEEQSGDS